MATDPENWSVGSERLPAKIGVSTVEIGKSEGLTENGLLLDLDVSLLRGVSLSTCLSGWGRHFSTQSAHSMYEVQHHDYDLSFQVARLQCFLSHDWATPRSKKVLAMLIHFNARAAMIAAVICAIIVGLSRSRPWQDVVAATNPSTRITDPSSLVPQVAFVLVLCFWQRVRGLFKAPMVVFLDKLCIAQHDPELKAKGILGLASFLDHSEELTILWSSRYYTRLWCCFELAAWFRHKASNARVNVLYSPTAWMLASWIIGILLGIAALHFQQWAAISSASPEDSAPGKTFALPSVSDIPYWLFASACCSCWTYQLLGLWSGIQNVNQQLRDFSVRHSECFCCSNNHVHPETGRILMCDRALVFDAVKQWYGEGVDEDYLDKFDREVRTTLRESVTANLGANKIMPQYNLFLLTSGMCSPFLSDGVTWMRGLWLQNMQPMLKIWRCVVALSRFYFIPVTWLAVFFLITLQVTVKMGFPLMKRVPRLLAAILAGVVEFFLALCTDWAVNIPVVVMAEAGLSDFWPFVAVAWFLFWWMLLRCLA
eukprot:Skav218302  [mRNA]  locus=scaffold2388:135156:136778:+ [translate_table: standard]